MRTFLPLLAAVCLAAGPVPPHAAAPVSGEDPVPGGAASPLPVPISQDHQEAIDRGLQYLASRQRPDGSFPTVPKGGDSSRGTGGETAVTSLSLLAFLGAGHGLRSGPYRKTIEMAVRWLLRVQETEGENAGYISQKDDNLSKMHGHGYATLALAEACGTAGPAELPPEGKGTREMALRILSRDLHRGVQAAVDIIQSSQALPGGWGYLPRDGGTSDHEGSVTVCQVQALLSASNRGFRVSQSSIERARKYMMESQVPNGGFKYRISNDTQSGDDHYTYPLAAAGVTSLLGLNEFDRRAAIERAFKFMERKMRGRVPEYNRVSYYFYGAFYAVQAYHWVGGERWERFWPRLRNNVLETQYPDGHWAGNAGNNDLGEVYPTAMSLLMLEVPVGYLSIFAK